MNFFQEAANQILRKLGYEKQARIAHTPSFPNVGPFPKTHDYLEAYKGWVYANVKRRAEQMASVEIRLMREGRMGPEEVFDHDALELLDKVNNQMTRRELFETLHAHLDLAGEGFWHVDRGERATMSPQSIVPLLPDKIQIVPGEESLIGGYIYRFTDKDGTAKEIPLEPQEVVFFKEPNPTDLFRGRSVVQAAAQTIDVDDSGEMWNWHSFRHGTSAKPAFSTEQVMDEESLKRQYAMLLEHWSGVEHANKPMILMGGLKAENLGMSNKDMEFIEGQKWTRDKIMALFGTTKTILGITEDVNRANAETNEFVFAKYMVKPRVEKVVDYLNEFYLPMFRGTERMFFMTSDPVPANAEQEVEVFSKALAGGSWMTPNEVREIKGLTPVDNGDSLFIPNTLVPVDGQPQPNEINRFYNTAHRRAYVLRERNRKRDEALKSKLEQSFTGLAESMIKGRILDNSKINFRKEAEKQGGFHDQMKQFARSMELDFKNAAQQYFTEQERETLKRIDARFHLTKTWKTKAPADELIFDKGQFKKIGLALFTPLFEKILEERGNEALFFIGSNIGFRLDNPRAQKFVEQQGANLISDIDSTTRRDLRKQLSEGLDVGEGIPELKDRVKNVFGKANDSRAEKIARTETIKASNAGQRLAWEQSGVVEGKQWLTAADERVDPICAALDGTFIPLRDNFFEKGDEFAAGGAKIGFIADVQEPPAHPMCRCTLIPVLKGEKTIARVNRKPQENTGVTAKDVEKLNKRLDRVLEML